MKVGWPGYNTTTRWVARVGTVAKPKPKPSMALILCEMRKEKNVFLY